MSIKKTHKLPKKKKNLLGHAYIVYFTDKDFQDEKYQSTLSICFHDSKYQKEEEQTWKTWLQQQSNPYLRPIELGKFIIIYIFSKLLFLKKKTKKKDKKLSSNINRIDTSLFNAIQFTWNGKKKAKLVIKINCLSTEFIKAKGVKGIQLRYLNYILTFSSFRIFFFFFSRDQNK